MCKTYILAISIKFYTHDHTLEPSAQLAVEALVGRLTLESGLHPRFNGILHQLKKATGNTSNLIVRFRRTLNDNIAKKIDKNKKKIILTF